MNPEQLYMLGTQYTALEAGDFDGYYYTYTVETDGELLISFVSITEGVEADISVSIEGSYAMPTLNEDGVDGVLTLDVVSGDVLTVQVAALPDANWQYPEATIFWDINYPAGTELNPLMVEFTMNDEWTEGEATVTVPANSTLYCGCWNSGMILTINGGNEQMLTAMGMGRVPAYFNVVNDTDAEAEYVLNVKYPEGTQMNPEVSKKLGTLEVSLKAGNYDGYYYTFTAIADGVVEFSIDSITEGVEADVIVTNQNSVQKTLAADGNKEGVLTVEVAKGDVLTIQVVVLPDATWNYPAADIAVNAKLTYDVLFGDVNGDGEVGISDLMRLANHFAKGVEINEANADCNGDGEVGISDLMRLANHFAKGVALGS